MSIQLIVDLDDSKNSNQYSSIPEFGGIPGELWKHIDFEPGLKPYYWISIYGRIGSVIDGVYKIMTPTFNGKGYLQINLQKLDNSRITRKLHRLVMMAFNPIPNPEEFEVNHKNGIKTNNCLYNLEWMKPLDNTHHALLNNLKCPTCEYDRRSYIEPYVVERICELYQKGFCCSELMEILGLSCNKTIVYNILTNRTRTDITHKFNLPNVNDGHRMFTKDQVFFICKYINDNIKNMNISDLYLNILNELDLDINENIVEGISYIANGILYKKISSYYSWQIPLINIID